jgi:hypothetical protein
MKQLITASVAMALFVGCATVPSDPNKIYSASYVGDRGGVPIEEVIAAVPCKDVPMGFLNVHVALAGIINPKKTSLSDQSDVRSIILRLSPRISSTVVETIQQKPALTENLRVLREEIIEETNRVFTGEFSKWKSAEDYDVQIVVTGFYLTNGSVGRSPSGRSWWGW